MTRHAASWAIKPFQIGKQKTHTNCIIHVVKGNSENKKMIQQYNDNGKVVFPKIHYTVNRVMRGTILYFHE